MILIMISVLYVDDEPGLLEICRIFLEQTGEFRVDTSGSAQDALARLAQKNYDAVIADYQMPCVDGISFLKEIRRTFGAIPFILFTGRGREEVVIEALNCGADFYVQKGGDPGAQFAELAHQVHQAVSRNKAEHGLRESEKRLSDIINFLPDATFAIDSEGKVISWNHAIAELTGVTAAEMLGKGDYEYAIPFYGHRRPILIDLIFKPDEWITAHYSGIIRANDVLIAETDVPNPRGKSITVLSKASPLYNQDGDCVGAIESIRDITGQKHVERELRAALEEVAATEEEMRTQYDKLASNEQRLRESEEKYRTLIETTPDIVWEVDAAGQIVYVSPQVKTILGFHPEEMISCTHFDFMPASERERHKADFKESSKKPQKLLWMRNVNIRKDGKPVIFETSAEPIVSDEGRFLGYRGIHRDISGRVHVDEALRHANAKLNLLNSITRHDVVNELTVLQGYTQLAILKGPDPVIADFLHKIEEISDIIVKQIEFTKMYQDLGVHAPGWFNLERVLQSVKPADVLFSSMCTGTEIFADPMLEKVFANLFDNAIRHGEHVTRIKVACAPADEGYMITVEDNGVGIPLDEKQKIFVKGFGKHTGFGLFLVREILAITGISIHETGRHGHGARFEILVPRNGFRVTGSGKSP
jgi:PAS domain S-box-containing protein